MIMVDSLDLKLDGAMGFVAKATTEAFALRFILARVTFLTGRNEDELALLAAKLEDEMLRGACVLEGTPPPDEAVPVVPEMPDDAEDAAPVDGKLLTKRLRLSRSARL